MPISSIYETGKRSLLSYQSAISTTSGNIANVNNQNYARRRADLSLLADGIAGLGISSDQSMRMRQQFAEHQLWREHQFLGKFETSNMLLTQLENIFAEDTESGLSSVIGQFWNAWNDLGQDPESRSARAIVKDKGVLLANSFNRLHNEIKTVQSEVLPDIEKKVSLINQKIEQIRDFNHQLRTKGSPGLMDQRDKVVTELSKMIGIEVKEKETGEISIFSEGLILISDNVVNHLEASTKIVDDNTVVQIKYAGSDRIIRADSGELGALVDTHNNKIAGYLRNLDSLAQTLASQINQIHVNGFNLAGTTDITFFDAEVSGASDIKVNAAVINDPTLIATRSAGEAEGSSSIALAIFDLQFDDMVEGDTFSTFYGGMMTEMGNAIQEAEYLHNSQNMIIQQLKNQKDSISGVSLDEEMTKLIQYEQSYQAAAKIVTTVDEMVQTLLNMR